MVAISRGSSASPAAAPTSPVASSLAATTETPPTTADSGFADANAASLAAEQLLAPYIASQILVAVTDPACSVPETGAIGETFVCYAMKPGDLVIALRATIGEERLITLELVTNQSEPVESSVPAEETTIGG